MVREIDLIVVHCSATRPHQACDAGIIDEWHKAKGWDGIGYHAVIRTDGVLEAGRPLEKVGAHAYGHNLKSIGICMVGGMSEQMVPTNNFNQKQWTTLRTFLDMLHSVFPNARICGHRDLSEDVNGDGVIDPWEWMKDCPCFDVQEWYTQAWKNKQ
jgi:N-acetylmuramoyl-L-alanine amidase